ncbi:hypothetical protein, variant 4 [Blastomyces dermatitidis ATCC 26199]|nr:hypothetical protein BDFG_08711 [Blastomyces dermatitidis ATCC 26199]EQL28559.1 hypothetical protein, variant 1 [Blastomyces dermatitidis ATCC 26199]EQL28560.1 hypothetical protein, variant 2 [Blastomyces dermatitidis ATCC 26199]EQL28561.1 hypothetical protein, variant 3 [Blastomyces dermatitidis ATCC 26199]EQL28562.1 hypothetical protein, variant 4 [Blastomyces dermatitidis ATCC 26199]
MNMLKTSLFGLAGNVLALLAGEVVAKLPYNPSYISNPISRNQTEVYILSPKSSATSKNEFKLQSLDISTPFDISQISISEDLGDVPFATDDSAKSFIPTTDSQGILTVYTGDCHENTSTVWRLFPTDGESTGPSKWKETPVHSEDGQQVPGAAYLSSAVSYPSVAESSQPGLFVFGGMCPWVGKQGEDWVSAANYSQIMMSLTAEMSSSGPSYQAEIVTPESSPVAEAGFAMTPLVPAYSNTSSVKPIQYQSFVLTGGHTQQAFINMSRIALFSLPDASWSYILVNEDGATSSIPGLGDIDGVEPRSGHTALLTPDGSKIIVFGGWVGDISRPAQPQLAILEVGAAYGGAGDWKWTIPHQNLHGPKTGTGIFGHGAAMLPGGIMLVAGGYSIPQSDLKRSATGLATNTEWYLLNTSSETWITSYTPINNIEASGQVSHGPLSSTSQKAGLGVGVGIGFVVIAVIAFFVYRHCSRRSREHRRVREQALRRLALGAERPHFDLAGNIHEPMTDITAEKLALHPNAYSWIGNERYPRNNGSQDTGTLSAEKTGLLVEIPSPTRGLRRSMHSRGYQSASYLEDSRRNVGFSAIHPIDEGDECEEAIGNDAMMVGKGETQRQSRSSVISNPFSDSARYSDSHNTRSAQHRISALNEKSAAIEWADDFEPGGTATRALSPDKSDRTLSDLSEGSSSFMSVSSQPTNPLSLNRNLARMFSFRSQASGPVAPGGSADYEPVRSSSPEGQAHGQFHALSTNVGSSYDSYNELRAETARSSDRTVVPQGSPRHTTFGQLQEESGLLLGITPLDSSKSGLNITKSKARGWIGNVRRTLGSVKKAENIAQAYSVSPENMSSSSQQIQQQQQQQRSTSTSPTKSFYSLQEERDSTTASESNNIPRRAMSSSSSMLGRKQGAKDWGAKRSSADSAQIRMLQAARVADAGHSNGAASSEGGTGGSLSSDSPHFFDYDDDEEWDVEAAAEGRVVQITYTVPKERLRVVNPGPSSGDDVDDDSITSPESTEPKKGSSGDGGREGVQNQPGPSNSGQ